MSGDEKPWSSIYFLNGNFLISNIIISSRETVERRKERWLTGHDTHTLPDPLDIHLQMPMRGVDLIIN